MTTTVSSVFIDTETHRIGPGAVVPRLVCASILTEDDPEPELYSTADSGLEHRLDGLFTAGNDRLLVFHNAAFDVPVIYRAYPRLQTKIWRKMEAGEITDTMLREMLLNLATHGKLEMYTAPDGSNKRLLYSLDALVLNYTGRDISDSKKGEDAWRKNFALLDGLPAARYPAAASEYVKGDALETRLVFEHQAARANCCEHFDKVVRSVDSATFHTAAAIALAFVTERGMATDERKFNELRANLDAQLSNENLQPLIDSQVMTPADPAMPYKQHEKKARELLSDWLDLSPEDVDFGRVDDGLLQALQDAGVKVKAPTKASIKTKQLKRYVVAAMIAKQKNKSIEDVLRMADSLEGMVELASKFGAKFEKTDSGDVSTSSSVISGVADSHKVLANYQYRQKLMKLVTTEIPRMMWEGKLAPVVHFPFKPMLETGRTSSSATDLYPSANGQNVDPRAREVYVPRPGYVLCSCDYTALELVCVAHTTYHMFNRSVHRDRITERKDLHAYLGTRLAIEMSSPEFSEELARAGVSPDHINAAYEVFIGLGKEHKVYKFWRKLAKPVGLGFPSGLGAATMVELAMREPYNIDMLAIAEERFRTHEEEFDLKKVAYHAKKLHGMSEDNLEWTPMLKAIAFTMRLRSIWLNAYPEMRDYFAAVRDMRDPSGEIYFMSSRGKEKYEEHRAEWLELGGWDSGDPEPDPEDYGGTSLLCYTTPLNMYRAKCTYTAVCNGLSMQSPGAEGAKMAVIKAVRASLDPASDSLLANGGGFVVDFVHDELLVELKDDELLHERAMEVKRIMELGLQHIVKNVPVDAQPVLMRRWNKDAVQSWKGGRLVVWEPAKDAPPAMSTPKGTDGFSKYAHSRD